MNSIICIMIVLMHAQSISSISIVLILLVHAQIIKNISIPIILLAHLLIINKGKMVADGSVAELTAQASGRVHVLVEIAGDDVATGIAGLTGVVEVAQREASGDNRTAMLVAADGGTDVRPDIFGLARLMLTPPIPTTAGSVAASIDSA